MAANNRPIRIEEQLGDRAVRGGPGGGPLHLQSGAERGMLPAGAHWTHIQGVVTMNRIHVFGALAVIGATAASAWGCPGCSAPRDATLPGFWLLSPGSAAALYVLSAFLERPFLTWAGVDKHTLSHSLVAGALPMVALGFLGELIYAGAWRSGLGLDLLWMPASMAASAMMKHAVLKRRFTIGKPVRFWPILDGVVVSNIAIALLPLLQRVFGLHEPWHASRVEAYKPPVAIAAFLIAVVAVAVALVRTRADGVAVTSRRGFEVVPVPRDSGQAVEPRA